MGIYRQGDQAVGEGEGMGGVDCAATYFLILLCYL